MFTAVFGILSISAAFTRDSMALSSTWIPTARRSVATPVPPTAAAPTSGTTQPSSIATPSPAATTTHPIALCIELPPRRQRRPAATRPAPRESGTSVLRTSAAAPKTRKPAVGSGIVNNATGGGIRLGARPAERCDMDDPDAPDPWARQPLWTASGLDQQQLPRALYVVATPIGNAADVTLRALWVLRNADCIAAEDTRVTAPLLKRYGIGTRLVALHRHNERGATEKILARLSQGERIALVSDAGTPGISDPGAVLVRAARSAGQRGIPVPGASCLTAALAAARPHATSGGLHRFRPLP